MRVEGEGDGWREEGWWVERGGMMCGGRRDDGWREEG